MRRMDSGYTIVEAMIFLAVTSALFVSAMTAIGGQQQKTQFYQSVREFDSRLRDVINQVASGEYSNAQSIKCTAGGAGAGVLFTAAASDLTGKNTDCIFLGKVLQLGIRDESTDGQYRTAVYSVLGKRLTSSGRVVSSLAEAEPTAISSPTIDITVVDPLQWEVFITATAADYSSGGVVVPDVPFGAIAFYAGFANYGTTSASLLSGSQNVGASIIGGTVNLSRGQMVNTIKNAAVVYPLSLTGKGARMCLESASAFTNGKKYAKITLGGSGKELTTKIDFDQPVNCQPGL